MVSSSIATAALLSTGLISLAPNLLLFLFSVEKSNPSSLKLFLNLGQALASGALLGDVFLHALPHAEINDETGIWILAGFVMFLLADILARTISGDHGHHHGDHANNDDSSSSSSSSKSRTKLSAVALSLIADSLHNFTDGLAIGASFTAESSASMIGQSISSLMASRGGLATISVMLHEIPHEIGDFCTLIQAGFTKRQAILAQFVTAIAAMVGTLVALFVSDLFAGDGLSLITAGGFVYLASVTILPEVLGESKSFGYAMAQVVAFLTGVAFMQSVAILEEHDHSHHHHHGHSHHQQHADHHHHGHAQHQHEVHHHGGHDHHGHDHGSAVHTEL